MDQDPSILSSIPICQQNVLTLAAESRIESTSNNNYTDTSNGNHPNETPKPLEANSPVESLSVYLLERIFNFLNYGDLVVSRKVSRQWNEAVSQSENFLSSSIVNLSLETHNLDMIRDTKVAWRQAKIQFFHFDNNQTGPDPNPERDFFRNVITLEFHQCFLNWEAFAQYIAMCPKLEGVVFYRSIVFDPLPPHPIKDLTDADNYEFKRIMATLKHIAIYDVNCITSITQIILKLSSFSVGQVETLKIFHCPFSSDLPKNSVQEFWKSVLRLLEYNSTTLRNLILDIRSNDILVAVCPILLYPLCGSIMAGSPLRLEVFKLTPPYPNCEDIGIVLEPNKALDIFMEFLSTQENLKSLAFPHFYNLNSGVKRIQVLDSLDCNLEKLRVPGPVYLRRNFLRIYPNLKYLFIGDKCGVGRGGMLNPVKFTFDSRNGQGMKSTRKFVYLSTWAKMYYESGKLYHIIEKFRNLSTFEIDAMAPVLNDVDVQAIIKYLTKLRNLSITCCDLISDFGVTGIPTQTCQSMHCLSTIYSAKAEEVAKGNRHLSISSLKGLQKLHLIGQSKLTDVGVHLGIRFLELKDLHLPWNEKITDWGIKQVGEHNPSLEKLSMTGALASNSLIGFTNLIIKHPRIRHRHCRVHTIHSFQEDSITNPTLLTAVLWQDKNDLSK